MSNLPSKILYKGLRILGVKRLMQIKKGPLKGKKWSVNIPDSRYLLGTYETELAQLVQNEVKFGKRFIDIGANAGYFSLLASSYGESNLAHVAVEPFPNNVQLLKKHLNFNNVHNVEVIEAAVSDVSGKIEFSNSPNLAANTYKIESSMFGDDLIKVAAITLEDIAEKFNLDADVFIKIDVEGAELDVLNGGLKYLKTFHPNIVLATHDNHVKGIRDKCLAVLAELGYDAKVIKDDKIDGQEDFFCTHKSIS